MPPRSFIRLPENLQNFVLTFADCATAFRFSIANSKIFNEKWEQPGFWLSIFVAHNKCEPKSRQASAIRDEYCYQTFGIEYLFSWRKDLGSTSPIQALTNACRAVRGLSPYDKELQERALISLIDLMQWFDVTDDFAFYFSKQLLLAVASRSDIFTVRQIRELWEAYMMSVDLRCELLEDAEGNIVDSHTQDCILQMSFEEFLQGSLGQAHSRCLKHATTLVL
eukprot:gnl/MRDRNA2_/MRDRNA2_117377_c0_seq1.p1 gnl/MRDRNA2_/MRDRNA2_117377_c0~~gnl/MRDRNA2_/MRDRNA2_117377_c0_seq1.p1  ORF type:complete len:223 (-),score=36.33 gnl/MRDRNA2_/MRDRNA2_117377_c0_seq1:16-684(-)